MYNIEIILNSGVIRTILCDSKEVAQKAFEFIIESMSKNKDEYYKVWGDNHGYCIRGKDVSWVEYKQN